MPQMRTLARSSGLACLPLAAGALVFGKSGFAIGISMGYGVCVVLYAFLRSYVSGIASKANVKLAKSKFFAVFACRLIVICALLYLLIGVFKGDIAGFLTGFVISQIAMTIVGYKHLSRLRSL